MSAHQQIPVHDLRDTALVLTRSMCVAAERGDWNRVIEKEHQRRPFLTNYLNSVSPDQAADFILSVLQSDKIVMELGSRARNEAAGELRSINKGKRARVAYAESGE